METCCQRVLPSVYHCLQRLVWGRVRVRHCSLVSHGQRGMASSAPTTRTTFTSAASSGTRWVLVLLLAFTVQLAHADVIVLANRTGRELPLRFTPVSGQVRQLTLPIGENLPLYLDGKANVSFSSAGETKNYVLDANCAYFFGRGNARPRRSAKDRPRRRRHAHRGPLASRHGQPGAAGDRSP